MVYVMNVILMKGINKMSRYKKRKSKNNLNFLNLISIYTIVNCIIITLMIIVLVIKIKISDNNFMIPKVLENINEVPITTESVKTINNHIEVSIPYKRHVINIRNQLKNKGFYDKILSENDKYLLAKIAMAEAENQNIQTKTLVIMSVLNRLESPDFPDSISEIIFQNTGNIYQYSPVMQGGRWYKVEPDSDCYEALKIVLTTKYDYSDGALYFESCKGDSWHNKNLTYLYQSQDLRFYK